MRRRRWLAGETILILVLYIAILAFFPWHDHRFVFFRWFAVELTIAIALPGVLIQLWKSIRLRRPA